MDKCKICGTEFMRKYPRGKQRKIYCSKKCTYKDRFVVKICPTCGKEFSKTYLCKNTDYCSLSCIQRHPCQLCGKVITGRITFQSGEKKFCTRKCSNFAHRTLTSKKAYVTKGFLVSLKKFGKIQCDKCGIDDLTVICVHHIDGNRENNVEENLQILCANCHHREHWGEGKKRQKLVELAQMLLKHS